jgi:dTDP-4-amino-4,6-dideoxygalactose transaminase
MTAQGIGVGVHYLSIPEHPYYQGEFGWKPEQFPMAAEVGRRTVSLPLSAGLSDEVVADVICAVKAVLA